MISRGLCNGTLFANECEQTRPDDSGCVNEFFFGLLRNMNRPRPDCRGCGSKGGVLQDVCQQREVLARSVLTHERL